MPPRSCKPARAVSSSPRSLLISLVCAGAGAAARAAGACQEDARAPGQDHLSSDWQPLGRQVLLHQLVRLVLAAHRHVRVPERAGRGGGRGGRRCARVCSSAGPVTVVAVRSLASKGCGIAQLAREGASAAPAAAGASAAPAAPRRQRALRRKDAPRGRIPGAEQQCLPDVRRVCAVAGRYVGEEIQKESVAIETAGITIVRKVSARRPASRPSHPRGSPRPSAGWG